MNKFIPFIILLIFMINLSAQNNEEQMNTLIEETRLKFAPDKRTAIFNVSFTQDGDICTVTGETDNPVAIKYFLEKLTESKINFKEKISLLPSIQIGERKFGVVTVSVANLRTKPDHPAELASQALLGTPVKVLKYDDGFYLVQTPDKYIAWVDSDAIELFNLADFKIYIDSRKVIFVKEYGFAFRDDSELSGHVSDLTKGNILEFVDESKEFIKVKFPDGRMAFLEKSDAVLLDDWSKTRNPDAQSILGEAFNMMGIPYLWGGTSYKGIDCSGFTKTVFFLNGILLSRDASQQVNQGEGINTQSGFENLLPGDLLFFGRKANENKKERITHVGIYIGNMEYIHESGSVKINSFDPNSPIFSIHRLSQFVRAKRILTSVGSNGIEKISENKFYKGEIN
ncbi:MAG: glycoside hydrolase [Ignavibacteriales bacterium CG_4_9_14_3_um_filter_34_10]|nr:MAG: glycoside hydrolase [Ignavibacteriales bacterium CG_4_9_14_3_um_filter_34_10]